MDTDIQKYIKEWKCPICGADLSCHASFEALDTEGDGEIYQPVNCSACGSRWKEFYSFCRIEICAKQEGIKDE